MGGKCSCLKGSKSDSDNGSDYYEFDNSKTKQNNSASFKLKVNLSHLVALQSLFRGYFDRKRSKDVIGLQVPKSTLSMTSSEGKIPLQIILPAFEFLDSPPSTQNPVELDSKDTYVGEWNNQDQRHGKGLLVGHNGSVYEGWWKHDKRHGPGRLTNNDGSVYEGSWEHDMKNGRGNLIHDKGLYNGEFLNDLFHGKGVFEFADGNKYEGEWKNNLMHGVGILVYQDGRVYRGEFVKGYKDGFGEISWPDGRKYEGGWLKDKQHGDGISLSAQGMKRAGEWNNGKRIRWITQ